ncbi:MAG TPA: MFS transporter [Sphingobium sp.]|uniref:MFS transporter n=1 Tax=Sphingobium sp. TaxID=1912891 RepID=UPI002ED1D1F9
MSRADWTAIEEWRRFWPLALASCVGFSFMSFMTPAAGLFMEPLAREFGWTRTELSAGMALSSLIAILAAPFVGVAIDRHGARKLALPGVVCTALAVAAFSLASGTFLQWLGLWLVWGICSLFVQATTWSSAVAGVFHAGRGLALGVTLSGTALAQVIVPPLTHWLITSQGWRAAYVWLGLGWGSIAFILTLFFLFDARRLRPPERPGADRIAANIAIANGLSISQAWRSSALWRVAVSTFLILAITIAVVVHQFPILLDAGVPSDAAVWLVSLSGLAGVMGKLVTGTLLDRFHARWVGGLTLASTAVAYPLMMTTLQAIWPIVLGIVISGYAAGTKIQLCGYLTARYGGMRHYGAIFGFMASVMALASSIGPLGAGISYDHFAGYGPLLLVGTVISIVSGLLILSLGCYPDWNTVPA